MVFTQDEHSFSLKVAPLQNSDRLYSGLWLALVAIHETPPHITLISKGKYYSLSARKVDNGSPLERFINTIERKHISSLFIKIESNEQPQPPKGALNSTIQSPLRGLGQNGEGIIFILENIYKDLQPLRNTETTCLFPIKEFFAACYSVEFLQVNYVFEILAIAEKAGLLKEGASLFYEDSNSNLITLPKYTMEQIRNKIHEIASQIRSFNS